MSAFATIRPQRLRFPIRHARTDIVGAAMPGAEAADHFAPGRDTNATADIELTTVAQMDLTDDLAIQTALKTMANG